MTCKCFPGFKWNFTCAFVLSNTYAFHRFVKSTKCVGLKGEIPEEIQLLFTCFLECPWSFVYAEWIWLRVVGICFREGAAEPSSLFLSEVLVLTLNLLNF